MCSWNACVIARGQAEPPITTREKIRQLSAVFFHVLEQHQPDRRTAAVIVTFSCVRIS